jgi:two-component system sensor histidine kinase QseC
MRIFENKSLKKKLILALAMLMITTLIAVFVISFFTTRNEIEAVFDANLAKSSKLIFGLIEHEIFDEKDTDFVLNLEATSQQKIFHRYEHKIHSQIWYGNRLIFSSKKNLATEKPDYEGFKDITIIQKKWRAFVFHDPKSDLIILVLERQRIRDKLIYEILFSLLLPLVLSLIPLILIIILTVNKKLKPLDKLANKIEKMSSKTLQPFDDSNIPTELKPFINSFNALLSRLINSMESERRFTDYAAHELKTPLSIITLQAQLLLKNNNKEKSEEYLRDLVNGIDRMNHMINQLLTLVRLEPESNKIEKERFNLKNLSETLLKNYLGDIEKKNIEISFLCELPDEELIVEANKIYIEIMIGNLIDNSVKYSPENKKIEIEIARKSGALSFKITNDGPKISKENQRKIFNNFYRVNDFASENNQQGCGIGLAIVKKIVDLHNGSISFESKGGKNSVEVIFA